MKRNVTFILIAILTIILLVGPISGCRGGMSELLPPTLFQEQDKEPEKSDEKAEKEDADTDVDIAKDGSPGLLITLDNDGSIIVVGVVDFWPAYYEGIGGGDTIISIDETDVKGMDLDSVQDMLRGGIGEEIEMEYHDKSKNETKKVKFKRSSITEEEICTECGKYYTECECTPQYKVPIPEPM